MIFLSVFRDLHWPTTTRPPERSATRCGDQWASRRRARPLGQRARRAAAPTVGATRTCATHQPRQATTTRRVTCHRTCVISTPTLRSGRRTRTAEPGEGDAAPRAPTIRPLGQASTWLLVIAATRMKRREEQMVRNFDTFCQYTELWLKKLHIAFSKTLFVKNKLMYFTFLFVLI